MTSYVDIGFPAKMLGFVCLERDVGGKEKRREKWRENNQFSIDWVGEEMRGKSGGALEFFGRAHKLFSPKWRDN